MQQKIKVPSPNSISVLLTEKYVFFLIKKN